ncbi:MAG: hypothetical protein M3M99_02200 [Actinomycetota bacterium]|nr:hypothetical protein [Actinomycetota bacterium]
MITLGLTTFIGILWVIGLLIGLVALINVVRILGVIHAAARQVATDAGFAYDNAEIMSGGVKGVDQLAETESLANQVPDLASAYLGKLGRGDRQ